MEKARISRASIYRILKSMEIKKAISELVTDEKIDSTSSKIRELTKRGRRRLRGLHFMCSNCRGIKLV